MRRPQRSGVGGGQKTHGCGKVLEKERCQNRSNMQDRVFEIFSHMKPQALKKERRQKPLMKCFSELPFMPTKNEKQKMNFTILQFNSGKTHA